eukprot:g4151.t1
MTSFKRLADSFGSKRLQYLETLVNKNPNAKVVVLHGKSLTGKSSLAKAIVDASHSNVDTGERPLFLHASSGILFRNEAKRRGLDLTTLSGSKDATELDVEIDFQTCCLLADSSTLDSSHLDVTATLDKANSTLASPKKTENNSSDDPNKQKILIMDGRQTAVMSLFLEKVFNKPQSSSIRIFLTCSPIEQLKRFLVRDYFHVDQVSDLTTIHQNNNNIEQNCPSPLFIFNLIDELLKDSKRSARGERKSQEMVNSQTSLQQLDENDDKNSSSEYHEADFDSFENLVNSLHNALLEDRRKKVLKNPSSGGTLTAEGKEKLFHVIENLALSCQRDRLDAQRLIDLYDDNNNKTSSLDGFNASRQFATKVPSSSLFDFREYNKEAHHLCIDTTNITEKEKLVIAQNAIMEKFVF